MPRPHRVLGQGPREDTLTLTEWSKANGYDRVTRQYDEATKPKAKAVCGTHVAQHPTATGWWTEHIGQVA